MGPVEVKLHNLQIDKAYVDVLYRSKSGLPSAADKLREKIIMETCENALLTVLYPRTAIVIQIFEMDDGGGVSRSLQLINNKKNDVTKVCVLSIYTIFFHIDLIAGNRFPCLK